MVFRSLKWLFEPHELNDRMHAREARLVQTAKWNCFPIRPTFEMGNDFSHFNQWM